MRSIDGEAAGFIYARDGHPNAAQLADKLAELEGAEAGLVCASGMGAIAATLLSLLEPERPRADLRRSLRQDELPGDEAACRDGGSITTSSIPAATERTLRSLFAPADPA